MIKTRKELVEFLKADDGRLDSIPTIADVIAGNLHKYRIRKFIHALRYLEYYTNNRDTIWGKIMYVLWNNRYNRLQWKYDMYIETNVVGPGLSIVHPGYIWLDRGSYIGKNCTVLPRVLLGKKRPGIPTPCILIGDNCYIGTGSTILGPITIGNNVTIAAGAVVVHDVPDNCVVAGNPAKIIKQK